MRKLLKILVFIMPFLVSAQNDTIQRFRNSSKINLNLDRDFKNSNIGISISNGIEVKPLFHFEDFSDRFLYKFGFITNFKKDYGTEIVLSYDLHKKFIKEIEIESKYFDFQNNLRLKEVGVFATKFIDPLELTFILKPTFQQINLTKNFGVEIGAQKTLIYQKIYSEIRFGYFKDYLNYSFLIQSFVFKNQIGLNASFEKINIFDFVKVGVNYVFEVNKK